MRTAARSYCGTVGGLPPRRKYKNWTRSRSDRKMRAFAPGWLVFDLDVTSCASSASPYARTGVWPGVVTLLTSLDAWFPASRN